MISFCKLPQSVDKKNQQHTRLQIYAEYRSIAKNKNKKRNKKNTANNNCLTSLSNNKRSVGWLGEWGG